MSEQRAEKPAVAVPKDAAGVQAHLEERLHKLTHEVEDLRGELKDIEIRLRYLEEE